MTDKDWEYVEKELNSFFNQVYLKCDEYDLTLTLERICQFKNAIMFYVDGSFKGKWLLDDCEERKRFCRKGQNSIYSPKQKSELKKMGKRFLKERGIDLTKKIDYYSNSWNSFNSLKQHLIKNNTNIELRK